MSKIKAWYSKLPNAWKAGFHTAWQSALGIFLINLVGWLDQVKEHFTNAGATDFPAVSPLGKAVAAAVAGLIGGLVGVVFRGLKPGPQYPPDNQPNAGTMVVGEGGAGGATSKLPPGSGAGGGNVGSAELDWLLLTFAIAAMVVVGLMGANWLLHSARYMFAWFGFGMAAYMLTAWGAPPRGPKP